MDKEAISATADNGDISQAESNAIFGNIPRISTLKYRSKHRYTRLSEQPVHARRKEEPKQGTYLAWNFRRATGGGRSGRGLVASSGCSTASCCCRATGEIDFKISRSNRFPKARVTHEIYNRKVHSRVDVAQVQWQPGAILGWNCEILWLGEEQESVVVTWVILRGLGTSVWGDRWRGGDKSSGL